MTRDLFVLLYSRLMSRTLADIQAPISFEMGEFEKKFRLLMKSKVILLDKIMGYIVKRKGKQMRPMFVFLSAGVTGKITESTYRGAALIELLHTATLVHDDVVDDANYRRGFFSINALWKNKIAVLVGDYLLSRGLLLSVDHGDFDLLKLVSRAVREMSEGELLQMEKAKNLDITEEIYFDIIRQKTASLISSCCAVGSTSAGATGEEVDKMTLFGEKIGMAFQIKDDLFDYGSTQIGKPLGIDIREKKMTLPLIYSLNNAEPGERKRIRKMVKNNNHKRKSVQQVIDFVKSSGGIEYAHQVMQNFVDEAIKILEAFSPSDYKDSLKHMVDFTISRNK